jgi:hypothetical protein
MRVAAMKTIAVALIVGVLCGAAVVRPVQAEPGPLKLLNWECGDDYITGTVMNISKQTFRYVEVRVVLSDKQGVRVGDTMANTVDFRPGEKWRFKAPVMDSDYDTATSR